MRQETNENKMAELTDSCRLLVISHMPLAYAMAWRLKDHGVSLEDLRQEGCLGLCEAAMRYNEELGCRFATYANYWCRKMMLAAIHRNKPTCSLQDETFQEKGEDDILRLAQLRRIDDALQTLGKRERQVVRMYYGIRTQRLSLTEIANATGISIPRVSTLHNQALRKLETALRERPLTDYLTPWNE